MKISIRLFLIFLISFISFSVLFSCSKAEVNKSSGSYYCQFNDSTGKTITLFNKPQKVAVLFSSFAEMWTDAGGDVSVTVGDSIERGFVPKNTVIVDAGSGHTTINTELLLASDVDFVIGTADYNIQSEVCEFMNSHGVTSALFKVDSFEDYLKVFKIFTDICGTPQNFTEYGTDVGDRIKDLLNEAAEHKYLFDKDMLFIRAGGSARSTKAKKADDHFACAMLEELGMNNIADKAPVLYDGLSLEEIIKSDPDYIFVSFMGDENATMNYINSLFQKEGWNRLTAVTEDHVIFLPKNLFHYKPNSAWADAYEYMIKIICQESSF